MVKSSGERELVWVGNVESRDLKVIVPKIITAHNQDPQGEIKLWINNNGGTVVDSFGFFDFIKAKKVNLTTIGFGRVASGAVIALAAGRRRLATKHTVFIVHPPWREFGAGDVLAADDCVMIARQLEEGREEICRLLAEACCNNKRFLEKKFKLFMRLYEQQNDFGTDLAKKLGLIHEIV